jgi:hypothetical protein
MAVLQTNIRRANEASLRGIVAAALGYISRCQFFVHLFDVLVLRPAGSRRGSSRFFFPVGYATPAMTGIKERSLYAERGDGDSCRAGPWLPEHKEDAGPTGIFLLFV